ncbi:methyl-accepting chemotaxis protein [Dyella sp. BiH032]|uniref:methyl-accepting chemotaxis protein n=1 Tax=Dyella sp. BiH032 TaxID=3075430 RepID=UPI002892D740|nr:methyl-accepting chemotaxis protein [Dyella sp. BiH032]WNL45839.1 methyl-accepting chemotaxis protein [Dyella sp. BiH032]
MRFPSFPARFRWLAFSAVSLRARLILRLCGLMLLLLALGGAAAWSLLHADRRMSALVADALNPVSDVGRIQNDYADSLNALTHAGLTRLPSALDEAKTQIQSNRVDIERRWKQFLGSGLAREQAQLIAVADAHRKAAEQAIDDALKQLDGEQYDLAQLQITSDVQPAFVPLHADFANLFAKALQSGDDAAAAARRASRRVLIGLLAMLAVGLAAAVLLDGLLIRSLTTQLRHAAAAAQRMADGELGHAFITGREDEIGALMRTLRQMDRRLAQVVRQVQQGAASVTLAAERLALGNDTLRERTRDQAQSLAVTAAAMARMTEAVRGNAGSAALADRIAATAREHAEAGSGIVVETQRSVEAIDAANRRVGGMLAAIDTLAFQTRLLALNATIEAAHAGAHGRGFAVVADEVRQLAQRSASAARDIRAVIDDSRAKVDTGAELAERSGEVLQRIVLSATEVSSAVAVISTNSREQSARIDEAGVAVRAIDDTTRQNAALVDEVAEASRTLRAQAGDLTRLVGYFRFAAEAPIGGTKA